MFYKNNKNIAAALYYEIIVRFVRYPDGSKTVSKIFNANKTDSGARKTDRSERTELPVARSEVGEVKQRNNTIIMISTVLGG